MFLRAEIPIFARMDYIVWHINESEEELQGSLQHPEYYASKVANLKPGSRRMLEVLAVRRALKELFYGEEQKVGYDEQGRPYLEPLDGSGKPKKTLPHISISHTMDYAVVIASEHPVGIDIERRGKRVARVVSHFLKPEEVARLSLLAGDDEEMLSLCLHLAWSAKEAAFKVLGKDYYDLQEKTTIILLSLPLCQIMLDVEGRKEPMSLHFDYTDDYVLVWVEETKQES